MSSFSFKHYGGKYYGEDSKLCKSTYHQDGKMAAIKIRDAGEEWYIMPGGGQEAEETLNEAVCREVSEELGIAIECKEFFL